MRPQVQVVGDAGLCLAQSPRSLPRRGVSCPAWRTPERPGGGCTRGELRPPADSQGRGPSWKGPQPPANTRMAATPTRLLRHRGRGDPVPPTPDAQKLREMRAWCPRGRPWGNLSRVTIQEGGRAASRR